MMFLCSIIVCLAPSILAAPISERLATHGYVSLANIQSEAPPQATIAGVTTTVFSLPPAGPEFDLPANEKGEITLAPGQLPPAAPGATGWRIAMQYIAEVPAAAKRTGYDYAPGNAPFPAMTLRPPGHPAKRAHVRTRAAMPVAQTQLFPLGTLPPNVRLHAAYALLEDWRTEAGCGASFQISIAAPGAAPQVLHSDELTLREQKTGPAWQTVDLDLSAYAGKDLSLRLYTTDLPGAPAPNLAAPLWGNAFLYTSAPPAQRPGPSVILLSLDTLRADRLGCYGYPRGTSPALDGLAEESYLFEHALSPAPMTTPAHASVFTGVSPYVHRAGVFTEGFNLREQWTTLAQILAARGYYTAAQTEGIGVAASTGLARGFQYYSEGPSPNHHQRQVVRETFERAGDVVKSLGHLPLFQFVHTYQIHDPYDSPKAFLDHFVDPQYAGTPMSDPAAAKSAEERKNASDRYDAGIAYTDAALGAFLAALRAQGRLDDTWIIVFSDHGEEFWEHGGTGHARTLYHEALHVPLLIRPPHGIPGGKRVAQTVLTTDLFATVLALTGTPLPDQRDTIDLLPLAQNTSAYPRDTIFGFYRGYTEGAPPTEPSQEWEVFSARTPAYSYVATTPEYKPSAPAPKEELFDNAADPAQQKDVSQEKNAELGATRDALAQWRKEEDARKGAPQAQPAALSADQLEALKGLGYLK